MIDMIIENIPAILVVVGTASGWVYGYMQKISASESKSIVDTLRAGLAEDSPNGQKLTPNEVLDVVSKALDAIED